MRSLVSKLGAGLGVVASSLFYQGCEPPTQGQATYGAGSALEALAENTPYGTPREKLAGGVIGAGLRAAGQARAVREAAEAGKSNIQQNVNVYGQPSEKPQISENESPLVFTCAGWVPNCRRFIEKGKQIFYSGEKIYMMCDLTGFRDDAEIDNINVCLTNGSTSKCHKTNIGKGRYKPAILDATFLAENIGEGLYENTWFIDGKEVGRVRYAVFKRR